MGWFLALAVYAFSTAASLLLGRLRRGPSKVALEPEAREEPSAEEGQTIAYIAGTCWVQNPMVLWQGDYSTEEILDGADVVGYRYFLGLQLGLCLGPVDRLIEVRFDQKSIPVAAFEPSSGLNLSVTVSAVRTTVALPAGPYASGSVAAELFTDAIHAQTADTQTRIVYGYEIRTDWNDKWRVTFSKTGMGVPTLTVNFRVRPGWYSAGGLANEINNRWNLAVQAAGVSDEGGNLVIYDALTTEHFRLLGNNRTSTTIVAAQTTGLEPIGFDNFADTTLGLFDDLEGIDTKRDAFFFSVPPGTVIEWTHANTTCESLFGMTAAGPDFSASSVCDNSVEGAIPQSTFQPIEGGIRVNLNAPDLFGGDVGNNSEGGVSGILDVYFGADDQPADDYLAEQAGKAVPTYRGLCHAVMRKLNQGNSAYLKNPSFVLEKCPNTIGLTGGRHQIPVAGAVGFDANAACVLYDLLTDPRFGLGSEDETVEVDVESFRRAGETLYAEGLGISPSITTAAEAQDLLEEIGRHIDAVWFKDPETGLLTMDLIRNDYDVSELLVLDQDSVVDVESTCADWSELPNAVKVRYVDRTSNFSPRPLQIQDLASIQMLGRTKVEELSLSYITNPVAAEIAGQRALRVIGYPLKLLKIHANRSAWRLRPGMPFVLNWAPLGIQGLVCRVTRPRIGEIRNNRIVIDATQDPFGIERAVFSAIE